MSWEKLTMTDAGAKLLAGMLNGAKLTFTRVVLGDKTVREENLHLQTSVFSPISAPALIAGSERVPSENATEVRIQIRNDGVLETTRMRQVGLFARTDHDEEVLLGIMQDEIGEEVPAYNGFEWGIELYSLIAVSRTNNISVVVSPHVYVTQAELDAVKAALADAITVNLVGEITERDPTKPDYGLGGETGGGSGINGDQASLRVSAYTGTADVTVVLNEELYDADNVRRSASVALNGDMILEEDK